MADELDPILEARLRGALRADADAVPFTLRADTLRRVQAERRRARNMQRLSLMSAAAVVVVAVAGVFLTLNLRNSSNVATSPSPSASAAPTISASPSTSPSPSPVASTPAGLPSDDQLLTAAKPGSVQVARSAGAAGTFMMTGLAHRVAPAMSWACTGSGTITISLVNDQGAESELAGSNAGGVGCDGTPTVIDWPTTHDPGEATSLKITAADVSWVAMLLDTSRVPADEAASPLPSSELPARGDLQGGMAGFGDLVASAERHASDAEAPGSFGDVRVPSAVGILFTCSGHGAAISIANGSGATAPLGDAVCDGTVQAFTWTRSSSLADGSEVLVDAQPGTAWRAAAFDNSRNAAPTTHPTPAAACGKPDLTARIPPKATLYQGGTAIGTVSYYTTSWGSTFDDGIPVTPDKAFEATSGSLTLRIAGDVCANSWTVIYGVPKADGKPGIDPIGVLAIQAAAGTSNRENRIDLASLPSGYYVLDVNLGFGDTGGGAGLIRVHVP